MRRLEDELKLLKHSLADISKARKLLGYEIKMPVEEGLKKTFNWYREKFEAEAVKTS